MVRKLRRMGREEKMKWPVDILKQMIKRSEYFRDNCSQPRVGVELLDSEIEELEDAVRILEKEYERREREK